ncbi:hypothetical protein FRC07_007928 [Ceratobasidium sp. 392]|nr:hypothetical protein FRC07_007928 [Ceratobasidium sp. 392]
MLRFGLRPRLQHVIIESFPPRGTRPTPIWNLRELEPDASEREKLRQTLAIADVSEVDFLRWRNACVAPNIKTAVGYIRGANVPTPLWITSHILRRKIHNAEDASLAAHLALLAVPSNRNLVSAHESPLIIALEHIAKYDLTYALPATVSRILALPIKNHRHLVSLLSSSNLARSPIVTATLQKLVEDILKLPLMLSRDLWLQVWECWGVNRSLGESFTTRLEANMRAQGIKPPVTYAPPHEKTYTVGAAYFKNDVSTTSDSSLAALTAAAQSQRISARMLLAIAHSLIHGFFPRPPDPRRSPDESFVTVLIEGLVQRKAYSRAQAVWKDVEQKISSSEDQLPSSSASSKVQQMNLGLTPALFEAGLSAYATSGDLHSALELLDKYALPPYEPPQGSGLPPSPETNPTRRSPKAPTRPHVTASALNIVLPYLSSHAQQLVFSHSVQRWGIQPDSVSLETVMQGALRATKDVGESEGLLENLREFKEGFRHMLSRRVRPRSLGLYHSELSDDWSEYEEQLNLALDPVHQIRDRTLIQQGAIELFRSVVLGNWPFISGSEAAYGEDQDNLLAPKNIVLFAPTPLRRKFHSKASRVRTPKSFPPVALHPSPTPRFPNAHPTPRAWTAYLRLLPAEEVPEGLGWMRAADESMRRTDEESVGPKYDTDDKTIEMHMFRPERAALVDALVRWEAVALAGETLVGRALNERARRAQPGSEAGSNEVGPEGALRTWLVDWLGPANVPSREEVARARLESWDMGG